MVGGANGKDKVLAAEGTLGGLLGSFRFGGDEGTSFTRLKYTFSFCFFVHVIVYSHFFLLFRMQADNFDQFHRRYPKALLHNPFSLWQLRPLQVYVVQGPVAISASTELQTQLLENCSQNVQILDHYFLHYIGMLYKGHLVVIWRPQKSALCPPLSLLIFEYQVGTVWECHIKHTRRRDH